MGSLKRRKLTWWIRYYANGKLHEESAHTRDRKTAIGLLKIREGEIEKGVPLTAAQSRITFSEAAQDLIDDYTANRRSSLDEVERRIRLHLASFFTARRRLVNITTSDIRRYVKNRQAARTSSRGAYTLKLPSGGTRHVPEQERSIAGVSNGEINRELTTLKRMFSLAHQAGKIQAKPHIPMLKERNTRTGFLEVDQLNGVMKQLPAELRPVVEFAYITGWRTESEVLPIQWRQVDFKAGEIRLDPHTTKNDDGRVFPMTDDLRALLTAQQKACQRLKKAGHIVPHVFFRMCAKSRGGVKEPRPIKTFIKAWKVACERAGHPGRIPHDMRRSAVRNMVRRGVPERVAMQLTGHKTRSVFERYNIVSHGDLKSAAVQLASLTRHGHFHGHLDQFRPSGETKSSKSLRKFGGAARI